MTETSSTPEIPTPIVDLPTGEPIPAAPESSKASSADTAPSKTTDPPTLLKALPTTTDAFLSHLQRCLATPSGVDTLLLFICYTSRFTGAALTNLSQTLLRRSARELVALALTLPPKTAIIFSTTTTGATTAATNAPARLAALLGQRLKNLGSLASEARTIARLWALVGMYFWAKRLTLKLFTPAKAAEGSGSGSSSSSSSSDKLVALLDWVQFLSCAAFQVLENGAYLSGRGVLGWTPAQQGRAYVMGSRWLGVYTALELGRLLARLVAAKGAHQAAGAGAGAEEREQLDTLRRSMAINLAWAPLTLHWSLEKGFLNDLAVGAGGCIPGVLQMRKLWRDTA